MTPEKELQDLLLTISMYSNQKMWPQVDILLVSLKECIEKLKNS
jgi:hypothetical protein